MRACMRVHVLEKASNLFLSRYKMSKRPGLLSLVWVTMNDTQDGVGGHSRLKTETSERFTVKI